MKNSKKANYLSKSIFIVAGVICIINGLINTESVIKYFPFIISIAMIVSGVFMFIDSYIDFKADAKDTEKNSNRITRSLLLIIVGIIAMCKRQDEMPFIGVVWGLIGLSKAEKGVSEILVGSFSVRETVIILLEAFIELMLSLMLLFEPVNAVGHHVVILGIQIITFGLFKMGSGSEIKEMLYKIQNK